MPSLAPKELPPPTLKQPKLTAPIVVLPTSNISEPIPDVPAKNENVLNKSEVKAPIVFSTEDVVSQPISPQTVQESQQIQTPPKLDFVKPEDIPIEMLESSEDNNENLNQIQKTEIKTDQQTTTPELSTPPVLDTIIKPIVKTKSAPQSFIPFLDFSPLTNIKPEIVKKNPANEQQSQNLLHPFLEQKKDFGFLTSKVSNKEEESKKIVSSSESTSAKIDQIFNAQKKKTSTIICEFCGAVVMASQKTCPACGSPIKK